jgi:WD40 repeat protein
LADKTAALQDVTAIAWADAATPLLVVATEAGPVQILDANTAAAVKTIDAGAPVDALAVAKGSNQIVTAARDGVLKVWDSASGELKRTLRGDPRRVRWNDRATRDVARQDGLLKRLAAISEDLKKRKENEEMAVVKATETRDKSTEAVKEPAAKFAAAQTDLTGTETKIADLTKQIGELKPKVDETSVKLKAAEEEANKAAEAAKTAQAAPAAPAAAAPAAPAAEGAAPAAPAPAAPAPAPAAPAPDAPKTLPVQVAEKLAEVKAQLAAAEAELKKLIATAEAELKTLNDGLEAKKKAFTDAKTAKENADAELVKHQQALDAGIEARDRLLALIAEHDARVAAETRQTKSLARLGQRYQRELGENAYPAVTIAFAPAGDRLATLHRDGSLRVYQGEETVARTVLDTGVLPAPGTRRPLLAFADANSVVLLGDGGKRLGWELKPRWVLARTIGNPLDTTQESPITDRVTAIDYHPDGKLIAVGSGPPSRTGQLVLFSTEDGKLVKQFEGVHSDTVLAVRFSPDGRFLASSAADKIVRILDPQKGIALKSLEGHTHHVLSLAWNDNAATLASASADQTVKVWDAENGTQARTIPGIGKEATSIRFVGVTGQVLTSGADGNVRLHESGDGKAIRSFAAAGDFLFSVAVTPDGGVVFTGGQEGILRAWKVADGAVVAEIKPQS